MQKFVPKIYVSLLYTKCEWSYKNGPLKFMVNFLGVVDEQIEGSQGIYLKVHDDRAMGSQCRHP